MSRGSSRKTKRRGPIHILITSWNRSPHLRKVLKMTVSRKTCVNVSVYHPYRHINCGELKLFPVSRAAWRDRINSSRERHKYIRLIESKKYFSRCSSFFFTCSVESEDRDNVDVTRTNVITICVIAERFNFWDANRELNYCLRCVSGELQLSHSSVWRDCLTGSLEPPLLSWLQIITINI